MHFRVLLAASVLFALSASAASSAPVEGQVLAVEKVELSGETFTNVRLKLDKCAGQYCGGRVNVLFPGDVKLVRGAWLELRLPEATVANLHAYKIRKGRASLALRADAPPGPRPEPTRLTQAR